VDHPLPSRSDTPRSGALTDQESRHDLRHLTGSTNRSRSTRKAEQLRHPVDPTTLREVIRKYLEAEQLTSDEGLEWGHFPKIAPAR